MYITIDELRKQIALQHTRANTHSRLDLTFCGVSVTIKVSRAIKALMSSPSNTCGGGCGTVADGLLLDKHYPHSHAKCKQRAKKLTTITKIMGKNSQGFSVLMNADHIVPQKHGGKHAAVNLQIMCKSCNEAKGNRYPSEVILSRKWWKKLSLIEPTEETVYET